LDVVRHEGRQVKLGFWSIYRAVIEYGRLQKESGTAPAREVAQRYILCSAVNFPMVEGIVPDSPVLSK